MSPTSGSGTGTPITSPVIPVGPGSGGSSIVVAEFIDLIQECSAIKLARYAHLVGYSESPFWGINDHSGESQCRYIWSLSNRLMVAKYLCEAQVEIEAVLGYLIGRQWIQENKKPCRNPILAKYGHVIAFGVKAITDILNGAAVNYATDPAIIGPIATSVMDTTEIVVFHPGTGIEITPNKVTISGGVLFIEIPRCRMVKVDYVDNPDVGWPYADVATWGEVTVDVRRRYNDTSTQVVLSSNHSCSAACASSGCTEYTQTACGYVRDPELGALEFHPSDYLNGAWIRRTSCCSSWGEAQLNYLAGVDVTHQLEDTIIRLAHSKMPSEPCGCDPIKTMWSRDRNVPVAITRERANCPFGLSDGAWTAWMFAKSMKLWRGGIVG